MINIDWDFIENLEGKGILKGYVPRNKDGTIFGNSGVTCGSGVDLAAQGEAGIASLGLPDELVRKLVPYTKYKKQDAVDFLAKNPLTLTQSECDELTSSIQNKMARNLEKLYNAVSVIDFDKTPGACQTIMMSLSYQYGSLAQKAPTFWKFAITQNWDQVLKELRHFGDAYNSRRQQEADYLVKHLK